MQAAAAVERTILRHFQPAALAVVVLAAEMAQPTDLPVTQTRAEAEAAPGAKHRQVRPLLAAQAAPVS